MKCIKRQRPFLETVLRKGNRLKRQALLQHANADQINAISELTLNLLKRHLPVTPATVAKLQCHKEALRHIARRKHSVTRRREELLKQKGAGFWNGLSDIYVPAADDDEYDERRPRVSVVGSRPSP